MPYDALGNYIPGPEDEKPASASPLASATNTLKQVATQYNPLMIMKTLQDVPRAAYNMAVAPLASTWGGVLGGVQAEGAAKAYEAMGMPEDAARVRQKIEPVTPTNYQLPMQTPTGEAFQEAVGKAFEASKAPHMWPLTPPSAGARPFLTPNDVRVMGAEATRVGRQVRDIPSDYFNAQSGFQRIDPVTGQPTMGARLQGVAEDVGRIVEQRKAQGLSPVPGVPEALTPETRAYAIRPTGTSVVTPQFPTTKSVVDLTYSTAPFKVIESAVGERGQPLSVEDVADAWRQERITKNLPLDDFDNYLRSEAVKRYPDAPSPELAIRAWEENYSSDRDWQKVVHQEFDNFLKTPEGQASPLSQLSSPIEISKRHEAAQNWLYGPFMNYMKKHIGTEADPLLKLASQGITHFSAEDIKRIAENEVSIGDLRVKREEAGLPPEGVVEPTLKAKQEELSAAEADLAKYQNRREAYRDIAMQQGLADPAQMPEYAATTNEIAAATRKVEKLQEQVNNLSLGKAYEQLADSAVRGRPRMDLMLNLPYEQRQFYPSITRAQPEETVYTFPRRSALEELGVAQIAEDFYKDAMLGKIPLDQIPKISVEKYVRDKAESRIKSEKAAALKAKEWKANADANMLKTTQANVPEGNYFGNVGAIELTKNTGLDEAALTKIISEDTTVLDHCIGQGGSAGERQSNPWFPKEKRKYLPIYDAATGAKNPGVGRESTSYTSAILSGDMITSIRDRNTGLPVATFHFHKSHVDPNTGKQIYSIGYSSGLHNGPVDKAYQAGIKDYLNSRADQISSLGAYANENLDIFDTQSPKGNLAADAGIRPQDLRLIDFTGAPRFMTGDEIKDMIKAAKSVPAEQTAPARPQPGGALSVNAEIPLPMLRDIETAFETGRDAITGMGEADGITNRALRALEREIDNIMQGPLRGNPQLSRLNQAIERFELAAADYVNQNTVHANMVGEALENIVIDLRGIQHAAGRGHYTPAAQVPAQTLPMTMPQLDQFIADTYRNIDVDVGDAVRDILDRIAMEEDVSIDRLLATQPTRLAELLDDAADNTQNAMIEERLRELSRILTLPDIDFGEPAPAQRVFGEVDFDNFVANVRQNQDAQLAHDVVRIANIIANELGTNVRGALENRPTEFATRLAETAERDTNPAFSEALQTLADRIAPPIRDVNAPIAEQLMEPEPGHPANAPDISPQHRSIANLLAHGDVFEISATRLALDPDSGNTYWAAFTPEERAAAEQALRARQEQLEQQQAQAPQQPQVADFRPIADHANNATYAELQQALTPGEQGEVSAIHDEIVRGNPNPDDIRSIAQFVYNHQMGAWQNMSDTERAMLYMELTYTANRMEAAPTRLTADQANAVDDAMAQFDSALTDVANDRGAWQASIAEVDRALDDLQNGARSVYGLWDEDMTPGIRQALIDRLTVLRAEYEGYNTPPQQQQTAMTPALRADANDALNEFESMLGDLDDSYAADHAIGRVLHRLRVGDDRIDGFWQSVEPMTPALRDYFIEQLERLQREFGGEPPPGRATGGVIRGYQSGGKVEYPPFYRASNQAITRTQEMYPGAMGQDDKADAARHMLASGYMSQSFGPTIAKGLGYLHELKEAPIRTAGSWMGLTKPRYDYEMDVRNNALGVELAQKAKDRADFERLVQESINQGRATVMTPEQANVGREALKYANGGTVSPSLDKMNYELLMRSK